MRRQDAPPAAAPRRVEGLSAPPPPSEVYPRRRRRAGRRDTSARRLEPDASDAACERRDAVVHCLRSAWPAYESKKWAKTPVEAAVLACAEKRHVFDENQRRRIDRLTTQVKGRQRGLCKVETETYREAESTFHPVRDVRRKAE